MEEIRTTLLQEKWGGYVEQRLEVTQSGMCGTLSTVQKDNIVLEVMRLPLRFVRTETGKALRKQYENHEIHHGFREHSKLDVKQDGCCNTLSTVQKDNMILEIYKIGDEMHGR